MSRSAKISLDFGDGEHVFRLGVSELEEIQEKSGYGPFATLSRLESGEWHIAEIRETIRLGLVGGGMKPDKAIKMVRRYVDERADWLRNCKLARGIMMAALVGVEEDRPPKSAGEAGETNPISPTDDGGSDHITKPVAQSA